MNRHSLYDKELYGSFGNLMLYTLGILTISRISYYLLPIKLTLLHTKELYKSSGILIFGFVNISTHKRFQTVLIKSTLSFRDLRNVNLYH